MPADTSPAYRNRDRLIRYQLHNGFLCDEGSPEAQRYDLNKATSPLLRLPPELRLQIYRLLLGDRQIHIRFVPWQPSKRALAKRSSKPAVDAHETRALKGRFRYDVLPYQQNPWKPGVDKLWGDAASSSASQNVVPDAARLTLLAGVCRQLYHETALLPQMLNTWSFESMHLMERYIMKEGRLSLRQRRAIEILYCRDKLPRDLRNKFKGLKVIVWRDNENLRWQELDVFPDVAWKDRQELLERSWRWHSMDKGSKTAYPARGAADQTDRATRADGPLLASRKHLSTPT